MRLVAPVLLVVGLIFGVVEANNPMPTPDYDEVCQYDCGGPSFSWEGLLWAGGLVALFLFFYSRYK